MRMKPILFSGDMVRAILAGQKTQTRRVIKFPVDGVNIHRYDGQDENGLRLFAWGMIQPGAFIDGCLEVKAPYQPGDILWVREAWRIGAWNENGEIAVDYKADGMSRMEWLQVEGDEDGERFERYWEQSEEDCKKAGMVPDAESGRYEWVPGQAPTRWRPSIHMPREAARILLRVISVHPERVQDITEEDARAEGVLATDQASECGYRSSFRELWNELNKKRGHDWYTNDWVWVIRFERLDNLVLAGRAGAEPIHQQVLRSAT